ncbi:hypothetical protein NA647_08880 [Pseudomonas stutzeri]|uniref:hypothetical protein n=1 Tax=Stutzerimonas stutzeri TaxID=316 RepID=UPI00210A6AD0|nr:hypothetical protein [Stutzerimonas stutzeri]MCQ4287546.1 hypothetical protein [Stutzerimonas stutzeri]
MSDAEKIYTIFFIPIFVWMFIAIVLLLHTAYSRLEEMAAHLPNCKALTFRLPMKHGGPAARLFLLGTIGGIVLLPKSYLKDGGADIEDIRRFPPHFKKRLKIQYSICTASVLAMIVLWAVGKVMGWIE